MASTGGTWKGSKFFDAGTKTAQKANMKKGKPFTASPATKSKNTGPKLAGKAGQKTVAGKGLVKPKKSVQAKTPTYGSARSRRILEQREKEEFKSEKLARAFMGGLKKGSSKAKSAVGKKKK